MSTKKPSAVLEGVSRAVKKTMSGIQSSVAEKATTRLIQAAVEIGLDIEIDMLLGGIGPDRTVGILRAKIVEIEHMTEVAGSEETSAAAPNPPSQLSSESV